MNLLRVAFAFARHHRVATVCSSLSLGLATSLLLLVLHVRDDVQRNVTVPSEHQNILVELLITYGSTMVLLSVGTIACTLYLTSASRRRDHAILRSLGALPREVFAVVLGEALLQVALGIVLGVGISRLALTVIQTTLRARYAVETRILDIHGIEVLALLMVFLLGLAASLAPAWRAYRSDVSTNLRRVSA